MEIDLCGHATLAAAFVLMNFVEKDLKSVDFLSKSGMLNVIRDGKFYKLNFPSRMPKLEAHNPLFEQALGVKVLETHLSRDFLVVVENENIVKNLKPNFKLLSKISQKISFGVIVTAKGDSCDFVSRFFLPNATIVEDPVTGSTHCSLIPFWSKRLNKTSMLAKQLSIRGGTLICEDLGERVNISGQAICYLTGKIKI